MSDELWQNEKLGTNDFVGLIGPKAFKDPDFLFGIAMNDGGIKKEISNVNIEKLGKYERKEYSLGELLRRQYGET